MPINNLQTQNRQNGPESAKPQNPIWYITPMSITAHPKKRHWYQVEWIAEQGGTDDEYDPNLDKWEAREFDDADQAWEFAKEIVENSDLCPTESARWSEHEYRRMEGSRLFEIEEIEMDWVTSDGLG